MTGNGYDLVLLQENFGTIGNNYIAAAPHHPFIQYALSVVTNNIPERDGDSIWLISGPGAKALAFCHFYRNQLRKLSIQEGVRIIDTYMLSNSVAATPTARLQTSRTALASQEQSATVAFQKAKRKTVTGVSTYLITKGWFQTGRRIV